MNDTSKKKWTPNTCGTQKPKTPIFIQVHIICIQWIPTGWCYVSFGFLGDSCGTQVGNWLKTRTTVGSPYKWDGHPDTYLYICMYVCNAMQCNAMHVCMYVCIYIICQTDVHINHISLSRSIMNKYKSFIAGRIGINIEKPPSLCVLTGYSGAWRSAMTSWLKRSRDASMLGFGCHIYTWLYMHTLCVQK